MWVGQSRETSWRRWRREAHELSLKGKRYSLQGRVRVAGKQNSLSKGVQEGWTWRVWDLHTGPRSSEVLAGGPSVGSNQAEVLGLGPLGQGALDRGRLDTLGQL